MAHDAETVDRLRRRLLSRRHSLVRATQGSQRELEGLKNQERNPEVEEDAQSSSAAYVLSQLSDAQRHEVAQIDAALARIEAGTYGECIDCGADIPIERLEAIPFALRDAECGERAEGRGATGTYVPPPSL
jgi:DnaK suppressor protein